MNCSEVQNWLVRKIDGEIPEAEKRDLEAHLAQCASCSREYGLLTLARRLGLQAPQAPPSPFFQQKLKTRIDREIQGQASWQVLWKLARHMIPAMAGITLALLSILAYFQWHSPQADLYKAYEGIFITEDQPHLIIAAEQADITAVSVLSAIAERDQDHQHSDAK